MKTVTLDQSHEIVDYVKAQVLELGNDTDDGIDFEGFTLSWHCDDFSARIEGQTRDYPGDYITRATCNIDIFNEDGDKLINSIYGLYFEG